MGNGWERLADHIRAELKRRGWNQSDLATAAGIGEKTVNTILSGKSRTRVPDTMPAIEIALEWEPGTGRRIINGSSDGSRDRLWQLVRGLTEDELETFLTEYLEYLASRRRNPA